VIDRLSKAGDTPVIYCRVTAVAYIGNSSAEDAHHHLHHRRHHCHQQQKQYELLV